MISVTPGDKFVDFCYYLNEIIATRFVLVRETYKWLCVDLYTVEEDLRGRYDLFLMRLNSNPNKQAVIKLIEDHDLEYLKVENDEVKVNVEFIKDVEQYGFDTAYEMAINA